MKKEILEKFKGALISKEEAKTIFGGYGLGGGNCNTPICNSYPTPVLTPCNGMTNDGNGYNYAYGMTTGYPQPTSCKVRA